MENQDIRLTLVPLSDDEVKEYGLSDSVALYMDSNSGVINVGRPSLAPYYPVFANMFGYNKAEKKGYYLILSENIELVNKPSYSVKISALQTVLEVTKVNSLDCDEIEEDLLSYYLKNEENKIRK